MQNSTSSGGKQTLSSEKQLLVTSNLALVGYVVSGLAMKLPTHIDRDELRSAGLEGLVQAAHSFAEDRGVPFRHFAALRIRGAIMDDLRRNDWASRSVRQAGRVREQAVDHLIATLGSAPKKAEIAEYMGVSIGALQLGGVPLPWQRAFPRCGRCVWGLLLKGSRGFGVRRS